MAHETLVPLAGKVHRDNKSAMSGVDVVLLLLHLLALATVGVASGTHLCHITDNALHHSADSGNEENEADPVVPYIRCEHGSKRSHYARVEGYLALLTRFVSEYFVPKTIGQSVEKAIGKFV